MKHFWSFLAIALVVAALVGVIIWLSVTRTIEICPPPIQCPLSNSTFFNAIIFDPAGSWSVTDSNFKTTRGTNLKAKLDDIYNTMQHKTDSTSGEFSQNRFALMFKPGQYNLSFQMGYYTHVQGLAVNKEGVIFNGTINVPPAPPAGYLDNFDRALYNLTIDPPGEATQVFGTSQASPIRRVKCTGNFALAERFQDQEQFSSGGFMSDCFISGTMDMYSQQQFYVQDSSAKTFKGGAWNFLLMGVSVVEYFSDVSFPAPNVCKKGLRLLTTMDSPGVSQMPMIVQEDGGFKVQNRDVLSDRFVFVHPAVSVDNINQSIINGYDIVFCPGIYSYPSSIIISRNNTTLIGTGYATIYVTGSEPGILIKDGIHGTRIAHLLMEAGTNNPPALIQVGETPKSSGEAANPTILYDIFGRCGPVHAARCEAMIVLNQNNSIVQHAWLWRADHSSLEREGLGLVNARSNYGIVVNGNDCSTYGLFSEHHLKECVLWNGDNGNMFFLQCELAYEAAQETGWNYPGLRVTGSHFYGTNLGVYSFFATSKGATASFPAVTSGIVIDANVVSTARIDSACTLFLNKNAGGGKINNVINATGGVSDINRPDEPIWVSLHNASTPCS